MRILILYNVAEHARKGIPSDLICEQEILIIVPLVADILRGKGYEVETLKASYNLWNDLGDKKDKIDIVFNLAEAFGGENANETLVPAMLETLDIPFTGASSHNMHFTLDKEKTKIFLAEYGIPSAPHQVFRDCNERLKSNLPFPLIVKPIREEASIGICLDSVVLNEGELRRKIKDILVRYRQPALVERFIVGREISVGIIGNTPNLHVFPPLEFLFKGAKSRYEEIRSYEYKWGGKKEQMVKANLFDEIKQKLVDYTRLAFTATECRDYARMDYRIDTNGNIFLLEVNYNPGIGPNMHGLNNTVTMMASFEGYTFPDLIEKIIQTSAKRYGIS